MTDFFYYWFHRWQHKISFLWEQHKFHHSEKSLNVTSTRRVHWLEDFRKWMSQQYLGTWLKKVGIVE